MKARIIYLVLVLILGISIVLSGCGNSSNKAPQNSVDSNTNKSSTEQNMVDTTKYKKNGPYKIGFSNISIVNSWRVQMVHELEAEAKRKGVTLYSTDANGDVSKQISDIQDLLTRGIDALLVAPGSPTATNAAMAKALQQGIPVIVFNAEVDGDNYTAFVGTNALEFGYTLGKWLVEQLGGKGNIIILDGMAGNKISEQREQGLRKAMSELPDGGKNINVLNTYYADWAYDKGKQATEQALAAYPNIDGVFSQGGAMTQGAIEAFVAAGRKLVPMTGEDNNGFLKLWKKMIPQGLKSIAASEPTWMGAVALDEALMALEGKPIPKKYYIPIPTITEKDLDKYVRPDLSDSFWCNTHLSPEEAKQYYSEK